MTANAVATDYLALRDVSVYYSIGKETILALDTVNLEIAKGETVCIVGPSGCGKTTILNIVAGFLFPSLGEVSLGGERIDSPDADRAVVFQQDAVFPWLTVRKNLEYGPRRRRAFDSEARDRVDHYLQLMGLEGFADAYPKMLSGGMRKRVDVARAYVNDPEVILLDEPFGAIDDMTKNHLQRELMRLSVDAPKTSIFITHDIEEAIYLGDRVVVMTPRPGKVKEVIDVDERRPRDLAWKTTEEFQGMRRHIQDSLGEM
ncbi:MAG TPA: ABC transporter ATP-binding protein [Solirubrobacterales bacterium]|nr:ABC transporter ATP-binding protein [Solirubrobacterales bacterium]